MDSWQRVVVIGVLMGSNEVTKPVGEFSFPPSPLPEVAMKMKQAKLRMSDELLQKRIK